MDDGCIRHGHLRCGPKTVSEFNIATACETPQLWHERLGHQDKHRVRKELERMEINMNHGGTEGFCDGCVLGKANREPFSSRSDRTQVVGELIHADVNGPMSVKSL